MLGAGGEAMIEAQWLRAKSPSQMTRGAGGIASATSARSGSPPARAAGGGGRGGGTRAAGP
jgi:hypothetical protein